MKPWNPYAMTFHGQPIIGQTPPKLVVYGPPLTAQQGAMLQTAYNAFVGAARASIVPNPTRQGRLTDGSPYTIECSQGVCTCTVWPVAAGPAYAPFPGDMMNGLLRGMRAVGPDGGPPIRAFLSADVGGGYKDVMGFHYQLPEGGGYYSTLGLFWNPGHQDNGLFGKLLQFMRGASAGYAAYFSRNGLIPNTNFATFSGVVAFRPSNSEFARVYAYSIPPNGPVKAIELTVVPIKEIVKKGHVPAEIVNIFGGAPIPPLAGDWEAKSFTVASEEALNTVAGFVRYSAPSGTEFYQNVSVLRGKNVVTSYDGKTAYQLSGSEREDGGYQRIFSRVLKLSFFESVRPGGYLLECDVTSVGSEGVADYIPQGTSGYIPGTTRGVVCLRMVGDKLTTYEVERQTYRLLNDPERAIPEKTYVNISGGINKRLLVYEIGSHGEYEGSGTFSNRWYAELGDKVVSTIGDQTTVSDRVFEVREVRGTLFSRYFGTTHGAFNGSDAGELITEIDISPVITDDVYVVARYRRETGLYWNYTVGPGGIDRNPYPFDPRSQTADGYMVVSSEGTRPPGYPFYTWDIERNPPIMWKVDTPPSLNLTDPQSTTLRQVAARMADMPPDVIPESLEGHVIVRPLTTKHKKTTLYTDRVSYDIDSEAVLKKYETPERIEELMTRWGGLPFISPMFAVRPAKDVNDEVIWPGINVSVSSLGAPNVVMRYRAFNWNTGEVQLMEINYGALAKPDMSKDHPSSTILFTGKT